MTAELADRSIPKNAIEDFLDNLPQGSKTNHQELVARFGYFILERLHEHAVTPKRIRDCYDAAVIAAPANITDVMNKSKAFVRTSVGMKLKRDAKTRIEVLLRVRKASALPDPQQSEPIAPTEKAREVVVIYGRDIAIRDSMFHFLRSLGLTPIEWNEAIRRSGQGTPYNGQVVDALFRDAQAVVAIFSPDEHVLLREDLRDSDSVTDEGWQPRPNVFIETGMAIQKDVSRTIIVEVGDVRLASDLLGRNLVRLDDTSEQRNNLVQRLTNAGCAVKTIGNDWLRAGKFRVRPQQKNGRKHNDN